VLLPSPHVPCIAVSWSTRSIASRPDMPPSTSSIAIGSPPPSQLASSPIVASGPRLAAAVAVSSLRISNTPSNVPRRPSGESPKSSAGCTSVKPAGRVSVTTKSPPSSPASSGTCSVAQIGLDARSVPGTRSSSAPPSVVTSTSTSISIASWLLHGSISASPISWPLLSPSRYSTKRSSPPPCVTRSVSACSPDSGS
jgi:hypothetical protein